MTLSQSRRWCGIVMRRYAKSFFWSTRFLPKQKREAIEALYGFCRYTDDAVDEGSASENERRARLGQIRRNLDAIDDARLPGELPWRRALACAINAYAIDRDQLQRLVDGCEFDLGHVRMTTIEQLERYSGAVAGSVGQCVIAILGLRDPDSRERAERLGIAMQLTNVLRDVREDWERGRQYVPVVAYGEAALPDVMRALAARARALYAETSVLAARLPNDGSRAAVLTASALYARILERLERRQYDPAGGRVSVGTVTKVRVALRCALAAHTGFATIK